MDTLSFFTPEDDRLAAQMEKIAFMAAAPVQLPVDYVEINHVCEPDDRFGFLHEAAIVEFEGILYASWYHCPQKELEGHTPICGKRSMDGGRTWTELEIITENGEDGILYCPPVYGICDGKLYMLVNEMVGPDQMHALNLYVLDGEEKRFRFLWSRPIPFKLNTHVVSLPNGKLMLPGRIAEMDGFPNTPAVLISDSGKIDAPWRLVKIAENGDLMDGTKLVHPELSVICCQDVLYMFCRNDQRHVPLVYISKDMGESWSAALAHDIPYISSKVYGGTLSDGWNYLIANTEKQDRSCLQVYFAPKGKMTFDRCLTLFDRDTMPLPGVSACHYPAAVESNGKLYVIATKNYDWSRRGAVLFTVDLKILQ